MVFKDTESLASLYAGITKQVEPSKEQLVRQAPLLSNTGLSRDMDSLAEAYEVMTNSGPKKCACKHAAKGCDCGGCDECKANQQPVEESKKKLSPAQKKIAQAAPPPDEITGADFKALAKKKKEMKESSNFKSLYHSVMNEAQETVCGTKINPGAQYNCTMEDGSEKVLKGESVLKMKSKCKSVKPAHKK